MAEDYPSLSETLRKRLAGHSLYRVHCATGLEPASLRRFLKGERSLRLDKADVLAKWLGLRLVDETEK